MKIWGANLKSKEIEALSGGSRAWGALFECKDTGPCKGDLQRKEQALSSFLRSESHESEGQGRREVKLWSSRCRFLGTGK